MTLFIRQVALQIGDNSGAFQEYTGLRVRFRVEMSQSGSPNEAKIEVYNLTRQTRDLLSRSDAIVRLLAGYDVPQQLFVGRPISGGVRVDRRETDRITTIEAQDGGIELSAQVSLTYAADVTAREVLDDVRAQAGLGLGLFDVPDVRFVGGGVWRGTVGQVLRELGQGLGRRLFVRDGAIVSLSAGGSTGERAPVFSVQAGNLIGSPTPKDKGEVEVRALLGGAEGLRPGKPFRLQSEQYTGDYVAQEVVFTGDTWGQAFYVEVTGRPL
ncbi:MAG: hypothetical protein AAFV53_33345 [Myxococcota bacterium]